MPETTKWDVAYEAREKTEAFRKQVETRRKSVLENAAVILSFMAIVLLIVLYSYNTGYCRVFSVPVESIELDIKSFLPVAIQICGSMMHVLYYLALLKTDEALKKNRISLLRILYGFCIVTHFLNANNVFSIWGRGICSAISVGLSVLIEVSVYLARKPRKNRVVNDAERSIMLEDYVYTSIFHTYYIKYGIFILVVSTILAPSCGRLKAVANRMYQTCYIDEQMYAVIVDYSDRILVQKAEVQEETLLISTDGYSYFAKDGIAFEYHEYGNVIIGDQTESDELSVEESVVMVSPCPTATMPLETSTPEPTIQPIEIDEDIEGSN